MFRLGIITSKTGEGAIILCREPCLHAFEDTEQEWNIDTWTPIIYDKSILSGIVQFPTEIMIQKSRQLENKDIIRLENYWKKNPKIKYEELKSEQNEDNKENEEKKYVDIYFKKLGFEQTCPKREKNESCSFCEDKPTIFCPIFNGKGRSFFTPDQYFTIYKTMVEREAQMDKELTMRRNTIIPSDDEKDTSKEYL